MNPTEQFHRSLLDHSDGKVRLGLDALRRAFQEVHPELAASPAARTRLRELLDRLQLDERIDLPKGREQWEVSALPALPRWVKLPREAVSTEKPDLRAIPWAPELRFLVTVRVFVPLADLLKLESVPKVGVLKFHARHEAWWERRERVIHIGVPKKFLRCNF